MSLGPFDLIQCPVCCQNSKLKVGLINSANPKEFYTDGYCYCRDSGHSRLGRCFYCKSVFWLEYARRWQFSKYKSIYYDLRDLYVMNDLLEPDIADHIKFVNTQNLFCTETDEKYLRLRIMQLFNDRIRYEHYKKVPLKSKRYPIPPHPTVWDGSAPRLFHSPKEKNIWEENISRIIKLTKLKSEADFFYLAEMNRYLKNFDLAAQILNSKQKFQLPHVKRVMLHLIMNQHDLVYRVS